MTKKEEDAFKEADECLEMSKQLGKALAVAISVWGYQDKLNLPIALALAAGEVAYATLAYNGRDLREGGVDLLCQSFKEGFNNAKERIKDMAEKGVFDAKDRDKDNLH